MSDAELVCLDTEARRAAIRAAGGNGLDYVEVAADQRALTVYFLGRAPEGLTREHVRIEGGRRIRDIRVTDLRIHRSDDPERDDSVTIFVDKPGDFSTYTLRLVALDDQGRQTDWPLPGLDPRYARLELSFKVDCPSELDCVEDACPAPDPRCAPEVAQAAEIDYLAKDYASFRQLILDRLSLIMPAWRERRVPDIGIALVELMAYVGDHLSYYQDAVATEAYLDTARQRISVRRHARLVDYIMHEGSNARAWVFVAIDTDLDLMADDFYFVTRLDIRPAGVPLTADDLREVPDDVYQVFRALVDNPAAPVRLRAAHSTISIYTWEGSECHLPCGATRATLRDSYVLDVPQLGPEALPPRRLALMPGDHLLFEEVMGPRTGNPADANPGHRHVVRLTRVEPGVDPLNGQPIVDIEWAEADALPFPLQLSAIGLPPECTLLEDISVARGNVILVDHGRLIAGEPLGVVPAGVVDTCCEGRERPAQVQVVPGTFRPRLRRRGLTFSEPLSPGVPAARALVQDPGRALPWLRVVEVTAHAAEAMWEARFDLLRSGPADRHVAVEIDNDGRAHLRFGNGELGSAPAPSTAFRAFYRVGNGPAGNVGAGAIAHIVTRDRLSGVAVWPRNPLPARGGVAPEPVSQVRLLAPHRHRKDLQRAIIAEDYARLVERELADEVQRAAATLRWTGSWHEVLVVVDPRGRVEAEPALLDAIARMLSRYRRIGHDVVVASARPVFVDLELHVCVRPGYLRGHVEAALRAVLSDEVLPEGRRGFFHPDNLTFGQGIAMSKLTALAHSVPGVESVSVIRLERLFAGPNGELEAGFLPIGPMEIARLDDDPSFPEHGRLVLTMGGGR